MRIRTVRRDPSTTGSQVVSALIGGIAGVAAGVVLAQLFGGVPGIAARVRRRTAPPTGPEPGYDADWEEPADEIADDEAIESAEDEAIEPADDGLGERVLEAFVNDPILAERAIDIEVQPNATVALSGAVDAEPEVAYAATLARGVPGVKRVVTALVTPA
jgi:BON domain